MPRTGWIRPISCLPLGVELEWVEKYFNIQGERFGKKIVVHKRISEAALDFPIYKMLLQPVVENSIIHGFGSEMDNPQIFITAELTAESALLLTLSDNGKGMDDTTLARVRRTLGQHGEQDEDGIGVANVASRLWHCYGEKSNISVVSSPGQGTTFTIIVPYFQAGTAKEG